MLCQCTDTGLLGYSSVKTLICQDSDLNDNSLTDQQGLQSGLTELSQASSSSPFVHAEQIDFANRYCGEQYLALRNAFTDVLSV